MGKLHLVEERSPTLASDEPAPFDESELLAIGPLDARRIALGLPLSTRFRLRDDITPVQYAFLQEHGYLVFARVASQTEVDRILSEIDAVEAKLLAEEITAICGVPVWFGTGPEGKPWLQRMGFSSYYSEWLEGFVTDARFEPVRRLIGENARIGTREKDGVVFNRYINLPGSLRPDLAWHTDALRDVFYNRQMPGPMLNVGLHFDRIKPEDGGLRVLPGTHTQGRWETLFHKVHFVTNDDDPNEVMVETWPGDLTVHDGRMWHRVKSSPFTGPRSLRRSMYVPYVIDDYQPKDEASKTNAYMKVFDRIMRVKSAVGRRRARKAGMA
ncbi:MAG: phytanoyl-CoA dioxygenase family protein [Phycisphaerales bacterium]|nr:phytanoyl-CoA dioxygenase family protein [Phycisphaerales bacterium]